MKHSQPHHNCRWRENKEEGQIMSLYNEEVKRKKFTTNFKIPCNSM